MATPRATSLRRAVRSPWTILALLVVVGAAAAGAVVWEHKYDTYRFDVVDPGKLYRDGNADTSELLNALKKSDSRSVVCLVHDTELTDPVKKQLLPGLELAAQDGRQLKRIQVPLGTWPRTVHIQEFLSFVEKPENQPALVHCVQGVRRTGMMTAAYQMSILGYDKPRAKAAIKSFGHSDAMVKDIETFIDNYDPASRTVWWRPSKPIED